MGSVSSCLQGGCKACCDNKRKTHHQQNETSCRECLEAQQSEYRYKEELKKTREELEQYRKNVQASEYRYKEELKKTREELEQYKNVQASEYRYKEELKKTRDELEQHKKDFEHFPATEYRYKEELKKTRAELQQCKKNFEDFQERMAFEASVDMGSSGALCEDINNPCRETELKKMYDNLRLQMLSKFIIEIKKSKRDKTINETKEKEKLKAMLQEVFTKAQHDMTKKKEDFLAFFQVDHKNEEGEKGDVMKTHHKRTKQQTKKLKYIELALQNLQMIIFHDEARYFQTVNKQLGNSEPDPLCVLADECYKVGCLMALHNPPLLIDWKNKEPSDYLPPLK